MLELFVGQKDNSNIHVLHRSSTFHPIPSVDLHGLVARATWASGCSPLKEYVRSPPLSGNS